MQHRRSNLMLAARAFARAYKDRSCAADGEFPLPCNPLRHYFESHREGNGIWKWEHYFDVYHRHFAKFVGRRVNVLEVGIYSGGSLEMWRSYFGEGCHVYGVDIEEACQVYESEHVSIFIGDQGDRGFWRDLRKQLPGIDIFIDDGGHTSRQQRVTLEEMLPFVRRGGVYLCEDIHGRTPFAEYAGTLALELNVRKQLRGDELASAVTPFQAAIHAVHLYPYAVVIEKNHRPLARLSAPKRGTKWQPFLD